MEKVEITIGGKEYSVSLAKTEEEQEKGLQNVESLPENEGMLFVFEEPIEASFWMKDTKIPLDIIFISEDMIVLSNQEGVPDSEDYLTESNVSYVLELNKDSGVKEGDELEFKTDYKVKDDKMYVLGSTGETQAIINAGVRIFSRPNTKTLIKFAKKAALMKNDKDYKALGSRLFKFITAQNNAKPDFVEQKEN